MTWDGKYRRKMDFDKSTPAAIWARVDERVHTLIENTRKVEDKLSEHEDKDDRQFKAINRTIYIATGGFAVIIFFLNHIKG